MSSQSQTLVPVLTPSMGDTLTVAKAEDFTTSAGFTLEGACPGVSPAPAPTFVSNKAFRSAEECAAEKVPEVPPRRRSRVRDRFIAGELPVWFALMIFAGVAMGISRLATVIGGMA